MRITGAKSRLDDGIGCSCVLEEGHVRFGSKADMCVAKRHVRSTPDSDRESEIPRKGMSALHPKADMCSATAHVCYGPIADMAFPQGAIFERLSL
jgi:hypothetical protein